MKKFKDIRLLIAGLIVILIAIYVILIVTGNSKVYQPYLSLLSWLR